MKNFVELEGTLTKDITVAMTKSNKPYARFTLAVKDDKWTNWISCIAWEQNASMISSLKKDDTLHFKGYIRTGSYEGKAGKVYTTDAVVSEVVSADSKVIEQMENKDKAKKYDVNDVFGSDTESVQIKDEELPFF